MRYKGCSLHVSASNVTQYTLYVRLPPDSFANWARLPATLGVRLRINASLLDHLVGEREQHRRHVETE
jgi:hypothetical protein